MSSWSSGDHPRWRRPSARLSLLAAAFAAVLAASPAAGAIWSSKSEEMDQLAPLIELRPGSVVAEIGAGNGAVTVAAAQRVGPTGHVFSTEIDPDEVKEIREAVGKAGLNNVSVVQASASDTGLPAECCNAVYMIGVYHHFTAPLAIDAGIFRALRPGGRLVIVDFRPSIWLTPWTPKGIPSNRGGHGIPEQVLEDEVAGSGFKLVKAYDHWGQSWFLSNYCLVFRKPLSGSSAASH